jgi:hypothetical protein
MLTFIIGKKFFVKKRKIGFFELYYFNEKPVLLQFC